MRKIWDEQHPNNPDPAKNPWSLKKIDRIKKEFSADAEATKKKYPELFYYFDGMVGTRVSQGIHPAGMVIAPIDLDEEYGVFDKDGERCLVIDMDGVHDSGCAKYDLLVLKTVQVIRDTCKAAGIPYPKTSQINFDAPEV